MINQLLKSIESAGNRLPHPTLLFIWLCALVLVLSGLLSLLDVQAAHPVTHETHQVINLLNIEGLNRALTNAVPNFTQFAPVGVVLVMMMGIGIAEHSGLISAVIKNLVHRSSRRLLAYIIAFAGVMSSLGADVGYVVLIPLAGMVYHSLGRPALAGIAVAFAGVSAGFSANLFIGPVDLILSSISTEAAALIDNSTTVTASDNYYFIIASTILITLACGWLSNRYIEPRLASDNMDAADRIDIDTSINLANADMRFRAVGLFSIIYAALLWALSAGTGLIILENIVPLMAIYFGLAGFIFGKANGIYQSASQAIEGMEKALATMAYYIVLMFFAAQFVSYFAWSNIGIIIAIKGAGLLGNLELSATVLLPLMLLMSACINLFIGSASAKWALLAPVFIPMLMLVGIPPEQSQVAYRVGDSVTNIITPLMPYFGIVLAYAQRYKQSLGIGDVIAMMLPYSLVLLVVWTILVTAWIGLGIPLGP